MAKADLLAPGAARGTVPVAAEALAPAAVESFAAAAHFGAPPRGFPQPEVALVHLHNGAVHGWGGGAGHLDVG